MAGYAYVEARVELSDILDELDEDDVMEYFGLCKKGDALTCYPCDLKFAPVFSLDTDRFKTIFCPLCREAVG